MSKLNCGVCVKYQSSIERGRNYSDKWIIEADCVRTSNIRDHAKIDQHKHTMMLLKKKEQAILKGEGPPAYAPIARLLHEPPDDALAC